MSEALPSSLDPGPRVAWSGGPGPERGRAGAVGMGAGAGAWAGAQSPGVRLPRPRPDGRKPGEGFGGREVAQTWRPACPWGTGRALWPPSWGTPSSPPPTGPGPASPLLHGQCPAAQRAGGAGVTGSGPHGRRHGGQTREEEEAQGFVSCSENVCPVFRATADREHPGEGGPGGLAADPTGRYPREPWAGPGSHRPHWAR